jgi:biopolymer transport protein TolR
MEEGKSLSLSASQRAKVRRLAAPRELAPDEEGGELNIVPFLDIIVNILIFVLATVAVTFTASIETTPPASRGAGVRKDIESTALNLTVFVVNEGFSIKASRSPSATADTISTRSTSALPS